MVLHSSTLPKCINVLFYRISFCTSKKNTYLKYFLECTYTDVKFRKNSCDIIMRLKFFFGSPYVSKNLLDLIKIKILGSRMKFCVRSYYSIFDVPFDVLLVTFLKIAPVLKRQKKI